MNLKKVLLCIVSPILLLSCGGQTIVTLETDSFSMKVDKAGNVTSLKDTKQGKEYLATQKQSPLVAIRIDGEFENPAKASWNNNDKVMVLTYPKSNSEVLIGIEQKAKYVTFEIIELRSDKDIEIALWGPYPTTISETVGECVGVVRNPEYAIGIQALNVKTLGGFPTNEDDTEPAFDIFSTTSLVDMDDDVKVLYRGQTAMHTDFGSVVQAYCRNRDKERVIPVWEHDYYVAPAYDDGGIKGTKIALFGCPEPETLDYIEQIELGEGLPHPELNGIWMKRNPEAAQAYIIYPFNENNIEEAIEFTKKTGLKYLYHGGPFETWGHFKLKPGEFPSGMDGLKKCVEKAGAEGIKLGFHTLSNFVTTNDRYVTPVPDKRLARVGSSVLAKDIDATQTDIEIADPKFFNQMKNNDLHGVVVGDELIRYETVSSTAPWKLLNCQRGAWGTKAGNHAKNDEIGKLMDHGYKVFLTDVDLMKEIARNIADIFNYTGTEQVSFDGLEGAWSTGMGQYGRSLMIKEWYDHLKPEYRNNINDASNTTHYNWHTFTRMNWGEPWYAGFRESQTNYRIMNQDFYRRNLIPCMLGWFRLDAGTSIEDIEWLLARTAAFDAGYTLSTNKTVENNGLCERIIKSIREWEEARLRGAFPAGLKKEMEHLYNEYTLTQKSNDTWSLFPYCIERYKHENIVRQPGEPVISKWTFNNTKERQPVQFMLRATDRVDDISIEIANFSTVNIKDVLQVGEYMKYDGGNEIIVYDRTWNVKRSIPVDSKNLTVPEGESQIIFSCNFASEDAAKAVSGEFKTIGKEVELKATRDRN